MSRKWDIILSRRVNTSSCGSIYYIFFWKIYYINNIIKRTHAHNNRDKIVYYFKQFVDQLFAKLIWFFFILINPVDGDVCGQVC